MLIVQDMTTGEIEERIGPQDADLGDGYEDALSSGWDPAMAEMIHRELDRQGITQTENPLPPDLADVDVEDFLDRMYTHMG